MIVKKTVEISVIRCDHPECGRDSDQDGAFIKVDVMPGQVKHFCSAHYSAACPDA